MLKKILKFFEDPRRVYELLVGLTLLLVMSGVAFFRVLDPLEMLFLDLRFQLRSERHFPSNITIVGVDEASLDAFGRWPWSRDKHAKLLDILNQKSFRPAAVSFDMLFEEKDPKLPAGDEDLAYRTKTFKSSVSMSYIFEKGSDSRYLERYEKDDEKEKELAQFAITQIDSVPEALETYDKVSLPFLELSQNADLGFVNTPADQDGRSRRSQLLARYDGKVYPSLDLLVALRYLGAELSDVRLGKSSITIEKSKFGRRVIPITREGYFLINYYCDSVHLPQTSYLAALDSAKAWIEGRKPELLTSLKDQIVLVGVTALGIGDRRTTPYNRYEPGVSLHAQTVANILNEDYLVRVPRWASYLALWFLGLVVIGMAMLLKISRSLPAVIVLGLLYFGVAYVLFLGGQWIDVAVVEITLMVIFGGINSFRYFTALEELKRTQEQLIQSTKMASLGQLSAGIAHEFRNILNAVNLHVEYCSRPGVPPERVTKYMGVIKGIMDNANLILNGLLTFARKSESVKAPGSLKKTVENTLLLIEKEMLRHQITVKTELEEVDEISYDTGQISQVIMNLMNNGRDALKDREGKEITLRVKNVPKGVQLDIGDNGSGIPPQVLKRLFEPFVTSKPAGKGTGLGLSVCHGIVKNHGGDIKVTTAQGQGTTWHIFLPKGS